jgi:uncharacterized phiE125 gp8 family phage protein
MNYHIAKEYQISTPRAELPVSLATAKSFMKVSSNSEDTLITMLIGAATNMFERFTNRVVITTSFTTYRTDDFCFELRRGDFQSLTSVEYLVEGTLTAYDFAAKLVQTQRQPYALFVPKNSGTDPIPDDHEANIKIVFVAGMADDEDGTPADVKLIILQLVAFLYENRADCSEEKIPDMLKEQMEIFKLRSLGGRL